MARPDLGDGLPVGMVGEASFARLLAATRPDLLTGATVLPEGPVAGHDHLSLIHI